MEVIFVRNKRGIFFTLLTIVLISLFLLTIPFLSGINREEVIQKRVSSLDSFVFSVEEDLSRQLHVSGFRTIFLMEQEIIASGNYISDVNGVFQEAFFNGTFKGVDEELLVGTTAREIENSLQSRAIKIGANITISNSTLVVEQEDPWNVKLIWSMNFLSKDNSGLAYWNRSLVVENLVPIENFEDPIYYLNTNGLINNKIVKTPYILNSIPNLLLHLDGSYYVNNSDAPNFLMRLGGNFGSDAQGIESLVNLDKLSSQGLSLNSGSIVDHIYFTSGGVGCSITGMGLPSWFTLDANHDSIYGVSC